MKTPKTEDKYKQFLIKHNIQFEEQVSIPCPFNYTKTHKVDFYLPYKDLYVEVKGFMTFYATNVLEYLLKYSGKKFCILQLTEEDWMGKYNREIHRSMENKRNINAEIQFNETLTLSCNELTNLSLQRLEDYKLLRSKDIETWLTIDENFKNVK